MRFTHPGRAILVTAFTGVCLSVCSTGCVRRTMTINTDPQGATVLLNDEFVGSSPVSVDFTWYGDYDVIIRHPGYETLKTNQKVNAPWYQVPPIDFVAEALMPFEIHDRREFSFALEPRQPVSREELLDSAARFRERTLYEDELGEPVTSPTQPSP